MNTVSTAAPGLNLSATLLSGQAFRWTERDGWFSGFACGQPLRVRVENALLLAEGFSGEPDIRRYFDLDRDYGSILQDAEAGLPGLSAALRFASGLRVLQQDPWETLVSFIISANNNVPRITGIIGRMCCGQKAFPSPSELALAGEDSLRSMGLGYRSGYVAEAARMVDAGLIDLQSLRGMETPEAREILLTIPGVGGKVADCVLLYGLQKYDVVPVDVWIKRAVEVMFLGGRETTPAAARSWAIEHFGPYAGIIQAYIFHYARMTGLRDIRGA